MLMFGLKPADAPAPRRMVVRRRRAQDSAPEAFARYLRRLTLDEVLDELHAQHLARLRHELELAGGAP